MELIRKKIPYCDLAMDRMSVYEESTDAIVPDSFPDIARIVCAEGMVSVKDESPQNDRVLVSGTVKTVVLYQPENGEGLRRLEVPLSFAHIEECKGIGADSVCFVRCQLASVEARAVNSRKVGVTARLCFDTSVYEKKEFSVTEEVCDPVLPLEILYDTQSVTLPADVRVREFTILDDIELPGGAGLELLAMDCTLRQGECRSMPGKLMLRGEAVLTGLALDDTGSFQTISQPIGFSQVLEMEGMTESQKLCIRLTVRNLDCALSGEGVLSVGVGARALVTSEETHLLHTVRDLYQTRCELEVQAQQAGAVSQCAAGELSAEGGETVPLGMRAGQFVAARAVCTGAQVESDDTLRVSAEVRLLYLDDEGQPYSTTRLLGVPLKTTGHLEGTSAHDLRLTVSAAPAGEDAVALRLSAAGTLLRREPCRWTDVTAVEAGAEKPGFGGVTLILRYAGDGESLWDIAKQYSTTAAAIRTANHMAEDQQTARAQMLLIPVGER